MAMSMKENGILKCFLIKNTVKAIKFGTMEVFMKVIGSMTKLMEEVGSSMLMAIYTMVIGSMIAPTVSACTNKKRAQNT